MANKKPTGAAKTYALQARVTADEHLALTSLARSRGLGVSEYIRALIREDLEAANIEAMRRSATERYERELAAIDAMSRVREP